MSVSTSFSQNSREVEVAKHLGMTLRTARTPSLAPSSAGTFVGVCPSHRVRGARLRSLESMAARGAARARSFARNPRARQEHEGSRRPIALVYVGQCEPIGEGNPLLNGRHGAARSARGDAGSRKQQHARTARACACAFRQHQSARPSRVERASFTNACVICPF